jgi:hypothetical protein
LLAVYPGAEWWADDTAQAQLLAAYVRRKRFEARLFANALMGGGQADERIAPSDMLAMLGGI